MEKSDNSPGRQPGFPHQWDFEYDFASYPYNHPRQERIRASSWDDSDDNLPSIPDNSGSKTCRIYSSGDKIHESSVSSELNELKKQFFKNTEKENQEQEIMENVRVDIGKESSFDRRLSPARIRRRSRSSGSSSPAPEMDCQISPTKINPATEFAAETQEITSNSPEYDPEFYLTNFFTELRPRRISLRDSMNVLEKTAKEESRPDDESIPMYEPNTDGTDSEPYFCKTTRKLSKILEVEENKKDLEKNSEENISDSNLFFKKKIPNPKGDFFPLQTSRSKKSEKSEKILDEDHAEKPYKERLRSLSSEFSTNFQKPQKLSGGSLTDRSARFFDQQFDDYISLSAKSGKTQLAAQKYLDEKQSKTSSPKTPKTDKSSSEDQKVEENFDLLRLLKIDLTKGLRSEDTTPRKSTGRTKVESSDSTPRKSTDMSEQCQTSRTKSGKSRKSWNPESPKFMINVGTDSGRSLKVEDVNFSDFQAHDKRKPKEEKLSCRKSGSWDSENNFESKTERIPHKLIDSPSVESEISTRRSFHEATTNRSRNEINTQRSHRKKRKQKTDSLNMESETIEVNPSCSVETTQPHSPVLSSRSSETQHKSSCRSKCSAVSTSTRLKETAEQHSPILSSRSSEPQNKTSCRSKCSAASTSQEFSNNCEFVQTPNSKSSRTSKSPKARTIKTTESRHSGNLSHQGTPRINKFFELSPPLDIYERPESQKASHRSTYATKDATEVTKDSDSPESKRNSRRHSEHGSSSRTRNTECSPRSLKITPRTNSICSRRSKDSLENCGEPENSENLPLTSWREFEKVCDTMTNHTSISLTSRSIEKEIPTQQHSYRSELYNPELENSITSETFEANNPLKERLKSRNSSRTSLDSNATECLDSNSPDRSTKTKSRPNSSTSKEFIPPDIEKLDINPTSGRTESSITEDEDVEGNQSTHRSKMEDESDRFSNKRLSVINEVSFEDLETSNSPTENDTWDQCKSYSEKNSHQMSPQTLASYRSVTKTSLTDTPNASGRSLREKTTIDESIELDKGQAWTRLIRGFDKCLISDNNFPGFDGNEVLPCSSIKGSILEEKNSADWDDILENSYFASVGSKMPEQNLVSFDKTVIEEKDLENPNFVYQNPVAKHDFTLSFQTHQNIHYVNMDKTGPFGIGEFGDVKCWDPGNSDIKDSEKPKEHGDGIPSPQTPEILIRQSEKAEKEVKNQPQLHRDFTDSTLVLNNLLKGAHTPCRLKASKSDICSSGRVCKENEYHVRAASSFLNYFNDKPESFEENVRTNREVKSSNNTINKHSSSDSLESVGDSEFDYERTPRLSKSLSNLDARLQESLSHREPSETLSISGSELFKKTPDNGNTDRDPTNLNKFLDKGDKISPKSKNWLNLKQGKKAKRRPRKVSPKYSFQDYLLSRKSRPSVPALKLRHPNCFQNFYKRIISVFCLTSNSSAATSQ